MDRLAAFAITITCALLGGCAVNCGADWREVGLNDGRIGADSQVERYTSACGNMDRERYAEGLQSGLAMRPRIAAF